MDPEKDTSPNDNSRVPLEDILATPDLRKRPSRSPDFQVENEALRDLSRRLGRSPKAALQGLAEQALKLCSAESAGISIEENDNGAEIFRWHAVSGKLSPFLNATMPRHFSPCGEVVDRGETLLMRNMIRHYEYVAALGITLSEVMLVPFYLAGKPAGTIWVVAHSSERKFDGEDQRLLESLAEFTSGIVQEYLKAEQTEGMVKQLKEEREIRERFVAALTHDLTTPLAASRMNAQLVQRKANQPEAIESLCGRIIEGIDRTVRMIRDMLDANRVQAGQSLPLVIEPVQLAPLIVEVIEEFATLGENRILFKNHAGPVSGYWDCETLQRVLENLISNAIKYGVRQSPITIELSRPGNHVVISVHNQGAPISTEDQKALFNSYWRTKSAATSGKQGWGIGLTLVKGIVEAHGGSVRLESSAETGTTFYITLPMDSRKQS